MSRTEMRRLARFRAGLILESAMGDWDPPDLAAEYGEDFVEKLRNEINVIATRLIGGA